MTEITGAGLGAPTSTDDGALRLAGDNVLVLMDHHRNVRELRTAGGIYLPGTHKPTSGAVWATVVAAGLGTTREPMPCAPGDRVLVDSADQGDPYHVGDTQHRIIRQHNILAVDDG